jgi:type IV secretion system protein VirB6
VSAIAAEGSQPSSRAVGVLFLGASVYLALMVMAIKTAATLVAGWRIPGGRDDMNRDAVSQQPASAPLVAGNVSHLNSFDRTDSDDRVRSIVTALPAPVQAGGSMGQGSSADRRVSAQIIPINGAASQSAISPNRAQGIGSRFRTRPAALPKEQIS